jgi:thiol-disulfide isomerase/thioredoxin
VHASIYMYCNFVWSVEDVAVENSNGTWQGKYTLPENCSFIAFKFYQGSSKEPDAIDNNNDEGYKSAVLDKKGKKLPGGALALALFEMPSLGIYYLHYHQSIDRQATPEVLSKLIAEELKIKNSDPKYYIEYYVDIQKAIKGDGYKTFISEWFNKLLNDKSLTQRQYMSIQHICEFGLKDTKRADAVGQIVLDRFPKSAGARFITYHKTMEEIKNGESIIKVYEAFLKKFPLDEWMKSQEKQQGFIYYDVYRSLANAYFDTKDYNTFITFASNYNFRTLNEVYRWNVMRAIVFNTVGRDTLLSISTPLINDLIKKVKDDSYLEDGFEGGVAQEHASEQLDTRLADHISILYKLNRYDEAFKFFDYLSPKGKLSNAELNEIHMHVLEKKYGNTMVQTFIESCVTANSVSSPMFDKLKQLYTEQHKDLKGYEEYVSSLKSDATKEEIKSYVKSNLMNDEYNYIFELEDMNGNIVKTKEWGDKIVVIDFWATWCKPCINALPGMQILVDRYANDPAVDFYFISTMQTDNYKEKCSWFIKKEGFRMKFLYDGINSETGSQDAMFKTFVPFFQSSAIPRKVILKNGRLRYSSEGYPGSASKLVDEISCAIELLKAE